MSDFLLSLKDVSLAFGGPQILNNVSLSINKGLRAALTGRNGEGKSTLFKVIEGTLEVDSGEIVRAPGLKIAYVSQSVDSDQKLSGGQIRKKRLEEALLSKPDILLLDEPTNHLDVEAIDWLEGMIKRQREMAVLIVTHDRRFLKRVATKIFDLDRGELSGWECDYATFVKRKAELLSDEAVYWQRKSKLLAQEEAWIRRGVKARTTRNEGRVAALMKLREEFAQRRETVKSATIKLDTAAAGGVRVIKVENLSYSYPNRDSDLQPKPIINDFTVDVLRGERIGILGRNGAGKTTLLNLLTGRLSPSSGSVTIGTNVQMAFLDQLRDELNLEATVAENIAADRDEVVVGGVKKHVYSYLADFLFSSERCRTPVKALSGGERARLMIAKLFMNPANLLIMDEPTNDLDIETLELLEEQLLNYKGTLLLVSHDREFLDNVVTSTLVLEGDGEVDSYPGGYEDYLKQRKTKNVVGVESGRNKEKNATLPLELETPTKVSKKLSYKEQRELDALPGEIEALEKEIAAIEAELVAGKIYSSDRLAPAQEELEKKVERWAELEERKQG
ncbi:MAG: ATP-binding cassette domain-containing protein [Kiritimatiellae bacterium]|nr:ATP-binding cassette domain-containing protein [Kiritimatiellia bacterium]